MFPMIFSRGASVLFPETVAEIEGRFPACQCSGILDRASGIFQKLCGMFKADADQVLTDALTVFPAQKNIEALRRDPRKAGDISHAQFLNPQNPHRSAETALCRGFGSWQGMTGGAIRPNPRRIGTLKRTISCLSCILSLSPISHLYDLPSVASVLFFFIIYTLNREFSTISACNTFSRGLY